MVLFNVCSTVTVECCVLHQCCVGFRMGTMLANFLPYVMYYVVVKISFLLVRNVSPRGLRCFKCLISILSAPCKLLCLLCFIASWT